MNLEAISCTAAGSRLRVCCDSEVLHDCLEVALLQTLQLPFCRRIDLTLTIDDDDESVLDSCCIHVIEFESAVLHECRFRCFNPKTSDTVSWSFRFMYKMPPDSAFASQFAAVRLGSGNVSGITLTDKQSVSLARLCDLVLTSPHLLELIFGFIEAKQLLNLPIVTDDLLPAVYSMHRNHSLRALMLFFSAAINTELYNLSNRQSSSGGLGTPNGNASLFRQNSIATKCWTLLLQDVEFGAASLLDVWLQPLREGLENLHDGTMPVSQESFDSIGDSIIKHVTSTIIPPFVTNNNISSQHSLFFSFPFPSFLELPTPIQRLSQLAAIRSSRNLSLLLGPEICVEKSATGSAHHTRTDRCCVSRFDGVIAVLTISMSCNYLASTSYNRRRSEQSSSNLDREIRAIFDQFNAGKRI